ncbi:MAG: ABC transporter ATP-binding protein [Gemmatimonadetes bacterium]|nr:MAG: ABC transporter ATP-binding protein [Gemmatimonadota bacterium]
MSLQPIMEVRHLVKDFPTKQGIFTKQYMRAVNDVSFNLYPGRALGIVGESGSGKSTSARVISLQYPRTAGEILFQGNDIATFTDKASVMAYRRKVQMIFQDPYGALNPVHTVFHHIARPLQIHKIVQNKSELEDKVYSVLEKVGLIPVEQTAKKYAYQLSGGQRQRVCIGKTLALGTEVVLADEPTSALDVSIRLGILNLMEAMKEDFNTAFLYITHDIATARYFTEEIAVMYVGHMVETGDSRDVTSNPQHPYTQLLLSAVPDPHKRGSRISLPEVEKKEIPTWRPESRGCPFASRCPHTTPQCREQMPPLTKLADNHFVRCFLHGG